MREKKQFGYKILIVEIPAEIHRWVKETAKGRNITISKFVRRLIIGELIKEQNGRDIK